MFLRFVLLVDFFHVFIHLLVFYPFHNPVILMSDVGRTSLPGWAGAVWVEFDWTDLVWERLASVTMVLAAVGWVRVGLAW